MDAYRIMPEDSVKPQQFNIQSLMNDIEKGKLMLPTFQRDYIWKVPDVMLLLDSIFHNYPSGVLLLMPDEGTLAKHNIYGAPEINDSSNYLVLDGQQRITSCYHVFYNKSKPDSGGSRIYYFIDLEALYSRCEEIGQRPDQTFDISKISLIDDKIIVTKRLKKEPDAISDGRIPFSLLTNDMAFSFSLRGYLGNAKMPEDKRNFYELYLRTLLNPFQSYNFQSLILSEGMDVSAVCRIFETLNNTGVKLDSFDICVAKFMADNTNLNIKTKLEEAIKQYPPLKVMFLKKEEKKEYRNREYVLQTIALYKNVDHKKNMLAKSLTSNDITKNWDSAIDALNETCEILDSVAQTKSTMALLPYSVVIPVISATLMKTEYKRMNQRDRIAVDGIIRKYFFYTAFNERYKDGAPGKMKNDYDALCAWISNGTEPDPDDTFKCTVEWNYDRFKTIKKDDKGAISMALRCILYHKNPLDFYKNREVSLDTYNLHHIFPLNRYENKYDFVDSIFNLTYLEKSTNDSISDYPVDEYVDGLIKSHGSEELVKSIFKSHYIEGKTYEYMYNVKYYEFLKSRADDIRDEFKREGLNVIDVANGEPEEDDDADEFVL